LPVINIAAALALTGSGKWSLDGLLGLRLPRRLLLIPGLLVAAIGVGVGVAVSAQRGIQHGQPSVEEAGGELQAGEEAAHPV
jgi:hypothetical protein